MRDDERPLSKVDSMPNERSRNPCPSRTLGEMLTDDYLDFRSNRTRTGL